MSDLRDKLIKLAHENPELRKHLLPLVKEAGSPHIEELKRTKPIAEKTWKQVEKIVADELKRNPKKYDLEGLDWGGTTHINLEDAVRLPDGEMTWESGFVLGYYQLPRRRRDPITHIQRQILWEPPSVSEGYGKRSWPVRGNSAADFAKALLQSIKDTSRLRKHASLKEGATQSPKAIAKWSIDMLEEVVITLVAPGGGAKDYDPEIWGYEADASLADTYGDIQKVVNLLKKANALLARVR